MNLVPTHLAQFSNRLPEINCYFDWACTDLSPAYEIVCSCSSSKFRVFKNSEPHAYALCAECNSRIILYDLAQYPTASTYPGAGPHSLIQIGGQNELNVFVCFEYPEDHETSNDVSWFYLLVKNPETEEMLLAVNDETA